MRFTTLLVFILIIPAIASAETPRVAVASNMTPVITELADQFTKKTGIDIRFSFGSSGNFARQILQCAPYDMFLSADKKYVEMLVNNDHKIIDSKEFARGRIGIFIPNESSLSDKDNLDAIIKSLYHGQYDRFTIANPEHAPYGAAAQQALKHAGVWAIEKNKMLIGENAAQAMQFTLSGSVDLGIIPASYFLLPEIKSRGKLFLIPEQWHKPIQQYIVMLKDNDVSTRQFYSHLFSDESKIVIEKYGYLSGAAN